MASITMDGGGGRGTVLLFARLRRLGVYTLNNSLLPIRGGSDVWVFSPTECKPSEGGETYHLKVAVALCM